MGCEMSEPDLFDALPYDGISKGICVMLDNKTNVIVYAGPIKGSPRKGGKTILMHPEDFALLKSIVDKGRH